MVNDNICFVSQNSSFKIYFIQNNKMVDKSEIINNSCPYI